MSATGDPQGAIAADKQAIRLEPKDARAHDNLGVVLDSTGDYEAAIAAFKRTIELDSKYARAHNNLGLALYHKKDLDGAVAAFRQAIQLAGVALGHHNLGASPGAVGTSMGPLRPTSGPPNSNPRTPSLSTNWGSHSAQERQGRPG